MAETVICMEIISGKILLWRHDSHTLFFTETGNLQCRVTFSKGKTTIFKYYKV